MKVTDEMVERAINDWVERSAQALGSRTLRSGEVARGMLEAALADVPEPVLDGHDCECWRRNYRHAEEECTAEREMAQQLEAKLAKVRAWLDESNTLHRVDLRAILGEP